MKALCLILLVGCTEVTVEALTVPPPGKIAQLDSENLQLRISRGVAFAFDCTESNSDYHGPCRDSTITTPNTSILQAFPSYLDELAPAWESMGDLGARSRSAFVVVGLEVGTSKVEVETPELTIGIAVTVE